jgi:hypothetical protein
VLLIIAEISSRIRCNIAASICVDIIRRYRVTIIISTLVKATLYFEQYYLLSAMSVLMMALLLTLTLLILVLIFVLILLPPLFLHLILDVENGKKALKQSGMKDLRSSKMISCTVEITTNR